jgi:AraC-like DNA-binding protein
MAAASQILADPEVTTLAASYRMGFTSDGNFCRWVQAGSGLPPSVLRRASGQAFFLLKLAEACFPNGTLERWESLEDIFLRDVA